MRINKNLVANILLCSALCTGFLSEGTIQAMEAIPQPQQGSAQVRHDYDQEIKPLLQKLCFVLGKLLTEDSHDETKLSVIVKLYVGRDQNHKAELANLRDSIRITLNKRKSGSLNDADFHNLEVLLDALKTSDFNYGYGQYYTQSQFRTSYGEKLRTAESLIEEILNFRQFYQTTKETPLIDLINLDDLNTYSDNTIKPVENPQLALQELDQSYLAKFIRGKWSRGTNYSDLYQLAYLSENTNLRENIKKLLIDSTQLSPRFCLELLNALERAVGGYNPNQMTQTWSAWSLDFKNPLKEKLDLEAGIKSALGFIKQIKKAYLDLIAKENTEEFKETVDYINFVNEKKIQEFAAFKNKKEVWILSLDGGGIRGLIGAKIMSKLEAAMKTIDKNIRITDAFDYYAGTSTGGLMAVGLTMPSKRDYTQPLHNTQKIEQLYSEEGARIFPSLYWKNVVGAATKKLQQGASSAYSAKGLEALLGEYFRNTMLSLAIKPTLVTSVDLTNRRATYFSSYAPLLDKSDDRVMQGSLDAHRDLAIWQAARATSAAPSYLPPLTMMYNNRTIELIDGGVFRNNPTALALNEVLKHCPNVEKIVILSIGTGKTHDNEKKLHEYNTGPMTLLLNVFVDIGMNQNVRDSELQVEDKIEDLKLRQKPVMVNYIRMNPESEMIELDGVDPENIAKLTKVAKNYTDSQEYGTYENEIIKLLGSKIQSVK